jgi:hypothetical protein
MLVLKQFFTFFTAHCSISLFIIFKEGTWKVKIKRVTFIYAKNIQQILPKQQNEKYFRKLHVFTNFIEYNVQKGHNDNQHKDTQYNDIQHNYIQHNDIQHNDIQHNDIQRMTFSIMTFSITTLSITTFSIITRSIITLSIMTFSTMAFSINGLNVRLNINDFEQNQHSA